MASLDLGKQVGPLPLGAWVVVVGAGLGIAYYTRRQTADPTIVESGNGTPGVGMGGSGMYTELVPVTQPGTGKPTTNEEWGVAALNWLIGHNYPRDVADQAVRKYLAGNRLSVGEYTLIGQVLAALGSPPQILPPSPEDPEEPAPDPGAGLPTTGSVKPGWFVNQWVHDLNGIYPGLGLTSESLRSMNPSMKTFQGPGGERFSEFQVLRVRGG